MNLTKIFRMATAAALAVAAALALTACGGGGQSAEDAIRASLVSELESIKAVDEAFVKQVQAEAGFADLEAYGIDGVEFMAAYLDGFDYAIGGISLNEDGTAATATVTFTCKSMADFQAALETDLVAYLEDVEVDGMTLEQINELLGKGVLEIMKDVPATKTAPFSIAFQNVEGTWTQTADSEANIINAMMG